MVNRTCLCGCGMSFKVFPTNTTNYFYSIGHAVFSKHRDDEVGKKAKLQLDRLKFHKPSRERLVGVNKARKADYLPQEIKDALEDLDRADDN